MGKEEEGMVFSEIEEQHSFGGNVNFPFLQQEQLARTCPDGYPLLSYPMAFLARGVSLSMALLLGILAGSLRAADTEAASAPSTEETEAPAPAPKPAVVINRNDEADSTNFSLPLPDSTGSGNNQGTAADLHWPIPAASPDINPDGDGSVTLDEVVQNVAHDKISIDLIWTLGAGCLTLFMALGLSLFQTGLGRARSVVHTLSLNFLVFAAAWLGFWAFGFALLFGGYGDSPTAIGWQPPLGHGLDWLNRECAPRHLAALLQRPIGLWGYRGFFLGKVFDTAVFTLFFFQAAVLAVAAAIPIGALAERWNLRSAILYGFWFAAIPYAIFGNWVWGGGWLAQLGVNYHLGHGTVDFAGSAVVHLTGGVVALVGAVLIGPRLGKYNKQGRPEPFPAHHLPMVFLGTLLLVIGAVGGNAGHTLSGTSHRIAIVAVNTLLAAAAGGFAAYLFIAWKFGGKPDLSLMGSGLVAGVVAIAGAGAYVNAPASVLIGGIAGILAVHGIGLLERHYRIDDPAGAISIHGLCGAWGLLAVGLFANGSYGRGLNGVHHLFKDGQWQLLVNDGSPLTLKNFATLTSSEGGWSDQGVTGLLGPLFGGACWDLGQFIAQFVGLVVNLLFVGGLAYAWFRLSDRLTPVRIPEEAEQYGVDLSQTGTEAYPSFHVTDRT